MKKMVNQKPVSRGGGRIVRIRTLNVPYTLAVDANNYNKVIHFNERFVF